jgi:lipid-A-disaccharide synthase
LKYFVLAGEASGDLQAALLCQAIHQHDPAAEIVGWGGEAMEAQGVKILKHYRDLAYMGFVEVVKHLPVIFQNFKTCRKEILEFKPEAVILVDYPGFNLRMASWAAKQNFPVYYYISPQLWAWHTSRVHKIKKAVRRMYVILPFEKEFYRNFGMEVVYIGHPLAVELNQLALSQESSREIIALLPGSRKHEVDKLLPVMIELAHKMQGQKFVIAAVSHLPLSMYTDFIKDTSNISIEVDAMRSVLQKSKAAVVTSGTATLETALMGVPEVVVYKGSPLSYQIAKRLIKVPYISLVNLIANKRLVPELIQKECNAEQVCHSLQDILEPKTYLEIKNGYDHIRSMLTSGGGAATAAIDIISDLDSLKTKNGTL